MENLRYKLAQYHPETSLYIGHRFAVNYGDVREGYMAGGGHIFSKKALEKFVTIISPNNTLCDNHDGEADDLLVGQCLKKHAIFLDARDSNNQKQIFPVGVEEHMKEMAEPDMSYWYWKNLWRNVTQGGLDCCSDVYIGAHYVSTQEMYMLEYLVYKVHAFGRKKNVTEEFPRKLTLEEIIAASDAKSFSPNFIEHELVHYIDEDEKYKRK
jgi:glycoprotein-N-acetylgalactosamine 3-beta-galactosyltransferase